MNASHLKPGDLVVVFRTEWPIGYRPVEDPICEVVFRASMGCVEVRPLNGGYAQRTVPPVSIIRKLPEMKTKEQEDRSQLE